MKKKTVFSFLTVLIAIVFVSCTYRVIPVPPFADGRGV